jgi:phosphoribosylformylglycinamidine synthase
MAQVRALVLRSPGANCDQEAVFALEAVGAAVDKVHINRLRENPRLLDDYQFLLIPGGFTYGDDVAAGRILAHQLRFFLHEALEEFREDGKLILGICNGFQVLLKAGLLVPPDATGEIAATLTNNAQGRFEDRWITMSVPLMHNCPFLAEYALLTAPIAHGEGRFLCKDEETLKALDRGGQLVLRYVSGRGQAPGEAYNPNGSQADVAGLCDPSGRVLGLMPHPERHFLPYHHPQWTRRGVAEHGDGWRLFRNVIRYFE